eukprot:symbB.v1.2.040097.t1/scaffold6950.1/size14322/1
MAWHGRLSPFKLFHGMLAFNRILSDLRISEARPGRRLCEAEPFAVNKKSPAQKKGEVLRRLLGYAEDAKAAESEGLVEPPETRSTSVMPPVPVPSLPSVPRTDPVSSVSSTRSQPAEALAAAAEAAQVCGRMLQQAVETHAVWKCQAVMQYHAIMSQDAGCESKALKEALDGK